MGELLPIDHNGPLIAIVHSTIVKMFMGEPLDLLTYSLDLFKLFAMCIYVLLIHAFVGQLSFFSMNVNKVYINLDIAEVREMISGLTCFLFVSLLSDLGT